MRVTVLNIQNEKSGLWIVTQKKCHQLHHGITAAHRILTNPHFEKSSSLKHLCRCSSRAPRRVAVQWAVRALMFPERNVLE